MYDNFFIILKSEDSEGTFLVLFISPYIIYLRFVLTVEDACSFHSMAKLLKKSSVNKNLKNKRIHINMYFFSRLYAFLSLSYKSKRE